MTKAMPLGYRIITWEKAETLFPGCSAMWDINGGPDWINSIANVTNVRVATFFSVLYVEAYINDSQNSMDRFDARWLDYHEKWEMDVIHPRYQP